MNTPRSLARVLFCALVSACGADAGSPDPGSQPATPTTPDPDPSPSVGSYEAGLQASGAIGFSPADDKTVVEFSAPITPRTDAIYAAEDASYPATAAGEARLAHDASMTYGWLLTACKTAYPAIVVPATDTTVLTAAERSSNYGLAARCAYEKFAGKPYWLPKLVDGVDICGSELGAGWKLPTESDLLRLSSTDIDFLSRTLTDISGSGDFFGGYYFTRLFYTRGADGTLQIGDLNPGAATRVRPLGIPADRYDNHFENALKPVTLRCVRYTRP